MKKYFLDKRVLKTPTIGGELANLQNVLDIQDYIVSVASQNSLDSLTVIGETTLEGNTTINADLTLNGEAVITDGVYTDTISENTPNAGVSIDGLVIKDGGLSNSGDTAIAAFYFNAAQNNITAGTGGAISVANYLTTINTDAGGDAFTLADGSQKGQMKKILLVVDGGGDGVVTPATAFAGGAATATFNDATDYLILMWTGSAWRVLENSGVTLA